MSNLKGKTAIVTGSSRGIGRAIAERLAAAGAAVIVNYRDNAAAAAAVVDGIADRGGHALAVQADIAKVSDIKRLFDAAEAAFGAIDIVVANASVVVIKPVIDSTEEDFDTVFAANARGTFFTMREAARHLRAGGRIVAVTTGGTRMFFGETALYLGSKGAVEQFVRVLSREVGARRITVNAVLPGFTDTDMLPERDRKVAAGLSPFARIGRPEEVADVVAFLASEEAGWVTAQNIGAGGGVM